MDIAVMVTPSFSAVIFDLDGTLIDSVPDITLAVNATLGEYGRSSLSDAVIHTLVGEGATELMARSFALTGDEKPMDEVRASVSRFLDFYEANPIAHTTVYPGVFEVLDAMRDAGLSLAICTNKPGQTARPVLAALNLGRYFPVISFGDSFEGIRKPDPRVLNWILDELGVTVDQAVMIGDSKTDVAAARNVGMKAIVRAGGYTTIPPEDLGADAVIAEFDQIWEAMERLAGRESEG